MSDDELMCFAKEHGLKVGLVDLNHKRLSRGFWFIFMGYLFSLGFVVWFFIVFLSTYLSPHKQVLVDINSMGEANLEFVLCFVVLYFIILGLLFVFKKFHRGVDVK